MTLSAKEGFESRAVRNGSALNCRAADMGQLASDAAFL